MGFLDDLKKAADNASHAVQRQVDNLQKAPPPPAPPEPPPIGGQPTQAQPQPPPLASGPPGIQESLPPMPVALPAEQGAPAPASEDAAPISPPAPA